MKDDLQVSPDAHPESVQAMREVSNNVLVSRKHIQGGDCQRSHKDGYQCRNDQNLTLSS